MTERCVFCGALEFERADGRRRCAVCGWFVGDAPDPDLPPPFVEVVYYLRYADRIKIGTSAHPRRRLAAIRHEELLAFERGGRALEQARHAEFADVREGGEWFTAVPALVAHAAALAGGADPWRTYTRWLAEARRPS